MGKVFLVGAGPGDIKLITIRGSELIASADVIIYDNLVNHDLLLRSKKGAERIYVGKQASKHALPQHEINSLLVEKAREQKIIVRLKGGDPFIFGRGGEEAEYLLNHNIDFEIVPGVTSSISVPAYAGIPLTHRDYASTVAFITGHEDAKKNESSIRWHELANGPDTLVFLMGVKNISSITQQLIHEGKSPLTPAGIITSGTLPGQKVFIGTLGNIVDVAKKENVKPPAIFVVGKVVELREKLMWFERKPFFGKTILITRAPHQSFKFGEELVEKGADVVHAPTIEIVPIEPNKKLKQAINHISEYTYIIFTSVNSVAVFFDNLMKNGKDTRALKDTSIIPIGQATAALLETKGVSADIIPQSYTSEGIAETLYGQQISHKKFLLPRAEAGRDYLVDFIRNNGGICNVVPIYKTTLPKRIEPLHKKIDIATFTSSSTVDNFITLYGKEALKDTIIASIGPITSKTLERHGLPVHIEAKKYDIPGLIDAMSLYVTDKY